MAATYARCHLILGADTAEPEAFDPLLVDPASAPPPTLHQRATAAREHLAVVRTVAEDNHPVMTVAAAPAWSARRRRRE